MQQALKSIFAVAEAYPQLQASQNFLQLQGELVDTEDKIQASRRFYNGGVRELNVKIKQFPNTLFVRGLVPLFSFPRESIRLLELLRFYALTRPPTCFAHYPDHYLLSYLRVLREEQRAQL